VIHRLSSVQRRILAVALLLVAVLVALELVVAPVWRTYFGNRQSIGQYRDDIERFSRLATQAEGLEEALGKLQQSDTLSRFVLDEESETRAAAALQERLKQVVTGSGGSLTSTQVLPAEQREGFNRITVNVRMAVSTEALQGVLYELESGLPYLMVDQVLILSRGRRNRRRVAPVTDVLDVRFNLTGYMREDGKPG
jgi:general secretion pathway protein M